MKSVIALTICIFFLFHIGYSQGKQSLSLQVSGQTRHTVFYVPDNVDNPPVVFFVHGANGSGGAFENETRADVTAEREKFIAVYPSASSNGGAGVWDDMFGTGNFPFFLSILDTLDARYQIDRNKIYMTGFSQGGFISFVAACSYSDVFAAVAPVSGHSGKNCDLKRQVPVFMTFGAQEGAPSFVEDLNVWLDLNNCPSTPEITSPYPESNPNSRATMVQYGPCDGGSYVVMDSISGQGHQWPSSSNLVQADEVWEFFSQFSLESETNSRSPRVEERPAKISFSYSANNIFIAGVQSNSRVRIRDTKGTLWLDRKLKSNSLLFTPPAPGIYLVSIETPSRIVSGKILVP